MRWYWTPNGWLFSSIAVGLLAGGAFVNISGGNETISNIMLGLGLLIGVFAYIRTYLNIKRINKEVEREQKRKAQEAWNKENEEYFKEMARAKARIEDTSNG